MRGPFSTFMFQVLVRRVVPERQYLLSLGADGSRDVMLVMLPLKAGEGPGADVWLSLYDPRTVITLILQMRMMRLGKWQSRI